MFRLFIVMVMYHFVQPCWGKHIIINYTLFCAQFKGVFAHISNSSLFPRHLAVCHTWSRSRGGHVVDEVLQGSPARDEGMIHGGVLLIGNAVVVGTGTSSTQAHAVTVAYIKGHHQQQTQDTHWSCDHRRQGHRPQRGGLLSGDC